MNTYDIPLLISSRLENNIPKHIFINVGLEKMSEPVEFGLIHVRKL